AFCDSFLLFAAGLRVWIACPRLIDFEPVAVEAEQPDPCGATTPVMSAFRHAKFRPRFLLTWAAATHCPRFLKPEQACCALIPVSFWILPDSAVFLVRISFIVVPCAVVRLALCTDAPCPAPSVAFAPMPPACPCCADNGAQYIATAIASSKI